MRYADATDMVPIPHTVAGVRLRPFCLGHHLLFKRLGLPFHGNAEADCGDEDIMLGIAVCGLSYEQTLAAIADGTLPAVIADWRKKVRGPWWNPTILDMDEITSQFRQYLAEGYTMPPTWRHDGKAGFAMSAPWEVLLKSRLMIGGFSESEAVNGYLPAMWYHYFALCEMDAAARCDDARNWRKVFYTREDAEQMQ